MRALPASFYAGETPGVARRLLGCILTTAIDGKTTAGRIVEVEAYTGPTDPAAHCFGWRRTARTAPMYGRAGTAYVYFTYGMHWCFNVVTQPKDYPSAVLIRALEPLKGHAAMRGRRSVARDRDLCSGPAKLCQALGIDGSHNGMSLRSTTIRITGPTDPDTFEIVTGPRIGITRAADWPLRFGVAGSPWLSRRFG